jgi:hypothetical protein
VRLATPGILTARPIKNMQDRDSANDNVALIEGAYERYANGDLAAILDLVDPDLGCPASSRRSSGGAIRWSL